MAQYRNPRGTDPHYHDVVNEIFDFYIDQISAICGVTKQELKSSSNMAHICLWRHALCYMLRKHHSTHTVRSLRNLDSCPASHGKTESLRTRATEVQCTLTVDKLRHRAESTVFVRGPTIHAAAVAEDMYAAIDSLADKLDRRVRRHKERLRDHHAPEAQKHGVALAH